MASPEAEMPKIALSWLVAMIIPDAVMKPDTTGGDRRLARNPSFSTPISSKKTPESRASTRAAAINYAHPGEAPLLAAVSGMREMTATGPTAGRSEEQKYDLPSPMRRS